MGVAEVALVVGVILLLVTAFMALLEEMERRAKGGQ